MAKSIHKSIFELYAHEYDLITNAAQREKYHQQEVDAIIRRFAPTKVLDAGCATGLTTMLFGRRQVRAVGLDRSRKMLQTARQKFTGSTLPISFRYGSFEVLPSSMTGKFDLVVCLANSISGVGSMVNLRKALREFYRVLRPGGSLVLQMLNYSAVCEGELLPIKVTRNEGIVYCRYSIRRGKKLAVHVIRLDLSKEPPGFEPFCHEFDNFDPQQVVGATTRAGFGSIGKFADLLFSRRFGKFSRDLVIIASRPK